MFDTTIYMETAMTLTKAVLAVLCVALALVAGTMFYALRERCLSLSKRSVE